MKVKNVVALIVCIFTLTSFATGCDSIESSSNNKEITNVSVGTTANSSVADASSKTDEANSKSDEANSKSDESTSKGEETSKADTAETEKQATITESVIVDQNGVVITAKEMGNSIWGPELKILIENNTDKDLTFQVRNASVNDFMADTMISEEVASGKKSNTEITFISKGLEACGIETFASMEFSFHIFTTDDWETYLDTEPIKIETSAAAGFHQEIDDSGKAFYDNNGIKIIGKSLSTEDSVFGPGLILYIENNSKQNITVQARDTSVNGFMIDTVMSEEVLIGKKSITALTFMSSSLEDNGITDIKSIETSFHVFDTENYDTIVDTDPIKIDF